MISTLEGPHWKTFPHLINRKVIAVTFNVESRRKLALKYVQNKVFIMLLHTYSLPWIHEVSYSLKSILA